MRIKIYNVGHFNFGFISVNLENLNSEMSEQGLEQLKRMEKLKNMKYRKIEKNEFNRLKILFPSNENMWKKYKEQRLKQFDNNEIDVFVIEENEIFIGELTINYKSHELESETIPGKRVYLEAFRVDKAFRGKRLGQKLINYTLDTLIKEGYTEFTIGVEDDNEIAKHIYFKLGFTDAIDKGRGDEFDPSE